MDRAKALALGDIFNELDHDASILEVGFGDGSFLKSLVAAGYSVTGTEISESMVKWAGAEIENATVVVADDPKITESEFDAVCCFEVLEHVEEPIALAAQFRANKLYASVPNPGRWYPAITGKYEYWDYPPNHLWRFCCCEPLGPDYHDTSCNNPNRPNKNDQPKSMSIRWVLHQAGFEEVSIQGTAIDRDDILRVVPIKRVSSDYDNMRPKGENRGLVSLAKTILSPATFSIARGLSIAGFRGVSYYIRAQRR